MVKLYTVRYGMVVESIITEELKHYATVELRFASMNTFEQCSNNGLMRCFNLIHAWTVLSPDVWIQTMTTVNSDFGFSINRTKNRSELLKHVAQAQLCGFLRLVLIRPSQLGTICIFWSIYSCDRFKPSLLMKRKAVACLQNEVRWDRKTLRNHGQTKPRIRVPSASCRWEIKELSKLLAVPHQCRRGTWITIQILGGRRTYDIWLRLEKQACTGGLLFDFYSHITSSASNRILRLE